ncbi:MAG: RNA polymerase sigma factor [Sneathiella sp.]|nr:RNA polymerase sigma factor [Sneathiella sp.]
MVRKTKSAHQAAPEIKAVPSGSVQPSPQEGTATLKVVVSNRAEFESHAAFWRVWNEHRDYLKRLSMMWMNVNAMDAEDALSLATLRAYEKYNDHADQINNERAWFARLLHNICIDLHRANTRRFRLNEKVKEVVEIDNTPTENVDLSPEGELLNSELGALISGAINKLPPKLKAPLVMRLVEGEEYADIAERLGISNDNARKRVQQARAILRRHLAPCRERE